MVSGGVYLTPLADVGVEMLAAVVSAVALWALGRLMRWLRIDGDARANKDRSRRSMLRSDADASAGYGGHFRAVQGFRYVEN